MAVHKCTVPDSARGYGQTSEIRYLNYRYTCRQGSRRDDRANYSRGANLMHDLEGEIVAGSAGITNFEGIAVAGEV